MELCWQHQKLQVQYWSIDKTNLRPTSVRAEKQSLRFALIQGQLRTILLPTYRTDPFAFFPFCCSTALTTTENLNAETKVGLG